MFFNVLAQNLNFYEQNNKLKIKKSCIDNEGKSSLFLQAAEFLLEHNLYNVSPFRHIIKIILGKL